MYQDHKWNKFYYMHQKVHPSNCNKLIFIKNIKDIAILFSFSYFAIEKWNRTSRSWRLEAVI